MFQTTLSKLIGAVAITAVIVGILLFAARDGASHCEEPILTVAGDGVELLESADGLEVVLTAEDGFYVGALAWVLRIGPVEFDRSYYPDFATTRLSFPIPQEAKAMLKDGDGIDVRYGNPIGSGTDGFAPAASEVDRASGFATLRVSDGC